MMSGMGDSAPVVTRTHEHGDGTIWEIMINRPEVQNCIGGAAAALLLEAWQQFRDDSTLTVAILHGAGETAFCSGADLSALDTLASMNASVAEIEQSVREGTGPMGGTRLVQTKPVITVTQGYTYAGGLELFCHGHLRIAEPQATFSVACRRWGVPLVDGGTVYLPRLLGWGHALPLIITGQRISAARAYQMGLVWEMVKQGEGLARAFSVAKQLCEQPRDAMFADLASAVLGYHLSLEGALEVEARNLHPVATSESTRAGVARFQRGERFWFT